MKKISLLFVAFLFVGVFTGCEEEDDFPFETKGATITISNPAGFFDLGDPSSTFSFDASSLGEAVTSFDVLKSLNGDTPVLHGTVTSLPTTVTVTPTQAVDGLGVSLDDLQIGDEIVFTFDNVVTPSGTYPSGASTAGAVSCLSALAGTYDFSTVDHFCGAGPATGQATWSEVGPGLYEIDDWAYGSYQECYGGPAQSWGALQLSDVCNTLSILGTDNYGDTWSFSSVTVDGANLTLGWTNTYGELGSTTLTRTDGTEWPPLTN